MTLLGGDDYGSSPYSHKTLTWGTIDAGAISPGVIRATDIRVGSIAACPGEAIRSWSDVGYHAVIESDGSVTAAAYPGYVFPAAPEGAAPRYNFTLPNPLTITWTTDAVTPEALRLMWGQPSYEAETLL